MGCRIALVLVVAGCGRLGFESHAPDAPIYGATPMVCDQKQWAITPPADLNVDLGVTTTPNGVSLVWAPHVGGNLSGIDLGTGWNMTSDQSGTSIKVGTYFTASLGYTNGSIVEGESDGGSIKLDTVVADLSGVVEEDCPTTTMVTKPPFLHAGPDTFAVAADWNGMTGVTTLPFDGNWVALGGALTAPSASTTGLAATDFGTTTVVVWSTSAACEIMQLANASTGSPTSLDRPCASPRLGASNDQLALVYESTAGVSLGVGDVATLLGVTSPIAASATSPRVAFDGSVFWYSYLLNGSIRVGYRMIDGTLREVEVARNPAHDAYELVMIGTTPWLFVLDGSGLGANMLCVPAGP